MRASRAATAAPTATAAAPETAPVAAADAGRTPTLHQKIDGAAVTGREAARGAGAGRIP